MGVSVRNRVAIGAGVLTVVVAILTAVLTHLSLERTLILAPMLVLGSAMILALLLILARAFAEFVRESPNPRRLVAIIAGLVAFAAVLTALGIEIPA